MLLLPILISVSIYIFNAVQGHTTLKANVALPCENEVVSFICITSGTYMYWRITPHRDSNYQSNIEKTFLLSTIQNIIESWHNLSVSQMYLYFRVNSYSPADVEQGGSQGINITLLLEVNRDLNGAVILCEGDQQQHYTVTIADPPSSPVDIRIVNIEHFRGELTSWAQVKLQWKEREGRVDNYQINTTNGHVSFINSLERSVIIMNVSYDESTITVAMATINCGRVKSDVSYYKFNITTCTSIEELQDTLSGNMSELTIVFSADNESASSNVFVVESTITFHCGEGYAPMDVLTAVCRDDGTWFPDPTLHMCIKNQITLSMSGETNPKSVTEIDRVSPVSKDEQTGTNNIIIWIGTSTGVSTFFFLLCVVCLPVCCCTVSRKRRAQSTVANNVNIPDMENIYDHPLYEEIRPRMGMQMEENAAYERLVVLKNGLKI